MSDKIYYAYRLKGNDNQERNFYVTPEQWIDRVPSNNSFDLYVEEKDAINLVKQKSNLSFVGRFRKFPRTRLNDYYHFKYESPETKRQKFLKYQTYINR